MIEKRDCPVRWRGIIIGTVVGNVLGQLVLAPFIVRLLHSLGG